MDQTLTVGKTAMERRGDERAGAAAVVVLALSAATLLGAWYFQYVLGYVPCHLCLQERIPYYVIIPLSLSVAVAARWRAPRTLIAWGLAALAAIALAGAAAGIYHAGVEWGFWAGPTDCTGSLSDLKSASSLFEELNSIHIVPCDKAAWRFLGISLAGYNALISLVMAALAGSALFAAKRSA